MNQGFFKGYYFKHTKQGDVVALIPGVSEDTAFVQIITNSGSHWENFNRASFSKPVLNIAIGKNVFGAHGVTIDTPRVRGSIAYTGITPIRYDVMGPFAYLPMECRHSVVSMRHELSGGLSVDGVYHDFTGGIGYIEGDSGRSFPRRYVWVQCNEFDEPCSVMASVADIPLMGLWFTGVICICWYRGREYRIASYLGGKACCVRPDALVLAQRGLRFEVQIQASPSAPLLSPVGGRMSGVIRESPSAEGVFRLYDRDVLVFELYGIGVGHEYCGSWGDGLA